jgi:hypothetical protein
VDVVVFCLSLMGTNMMDFIREGSRVLAKGGTMKVRGTLYNAVFALVSDPSYSCCVDCRGPESLRGAGGGGEVVRAGKKFVRQGRGEMHSD